MHGKGVEKSLLGVYGCLVPQMASLLRLFTSILFTVQKAQGLEQKSRLESERVVKYVGTARIIIKWLNISGRRPRDSEGRACL